MVTFKIIGGEKHLFKNPIREIAIIITEDGYLPEKIVAFQNEKIYLHLTSVDKKINCFLLPKQNYFISLERGDIKGGEFLFEESGNYHFSCPAREISGEFVILDRVSKSSDRAVAQDVDDNKYTKGWVPKK